MAKKEGKEKGMGKHAMHGGHHKELKGTKHGLAEGPGVGMMPKKGR